MFINVQKHYEIIIKYFTDYAMKGENPINSGSPPILFPYCSAIFPTACKNEAKWHCGKC